MSPLQLPYRSLESQPRSLLLLLSSPPRHLIRYRPLSVMACGDPSPSFFAAAMGDFEILNLYDAADAGFDPLINPTTSNSPAELFRLPCITNQAPDMMTSNPP